MKKITVVVILVMAVGCILSACSKTRMEGISDRAYDLGCAALETADEYLAGDITAEEACDALYVPSLMLRSDSCDGQNDILISSAVGNLEAEISFKQMGTATKSDVKEQRDILAEYLGKK